jgi:hypothetical protein
MFMVDFLLEEEPGRFREAETAEEEEEVRRLGT